MRECPVHAAPSYPDVDFDAGLPTNRVGESRPLVFAGPLSAGQRPEAAQELPARAANEQDPTFRGDEPEHDRDEGGGARSP